jgi:hypothetical protein
VSRVLLLLAGAALLFLAYVAFHPEHGTTARAWVWEVVAEGRAWDPVRAAAVGTLVFALLALVLATVPSTSRKGAFALGAVGVLYVAMPPGDEAAPVGLALLAGGALALAAPRSAAARWVLLAGVLVVAARLLLPLPPSDEGALARLQHGLLDPDGGRSRLEILLSPASLGTLAHAGALVLGVVVLAGGRATWIRVAVLLLVLLQGVGVPARAAFEAMDAGGGGGLPAASDALWFHGSAVLLWAVAGIADALGMGARRSEASNGTGD